VYVVNRDGSARRLLVRGATAPAWSPDGSTIAYRAGCGGVKLVTPDGADVTPMRAGASACRSIGVPGVPGWSPDGTQLAIGTHSVPRTRGGVYVMRRDGTGLRLLTASDWRGGFGLGRPAWRPLDGARSGSAASAPGCDPCV
jgi:Tol biopolymer transport system component